MTTLVHSFDVFDTVLTRPYSRPTDLFRRVALQIAGNVPGFDCDAFAAQRIYAEKLARRNAADRDDIQLTDIYRNFAAPLPISLEEACALECRCELDCVTPISETVDAIAGLQAAGKRVIFASDMYLPAWQLQRMLAKVGVAASLESIYVSGEIGLSKHSGRLFDYILNTEKVAPSQLSHVGDNWRADVVNARKRGIDAKLFWSGQSNRYERPAAASDHALASLAGLNRSCRLAAKASADRLPRLAHGVIAPFLTGFVAHVLREARHSGIRTLYFVARDGQMPLKIATELQRGWPDPISCRYLYGSRQAWFLPSAVDMTDESIEWAFAPGMSVSPRDILRRLEVSYDETAGKWPERFGKLLASPDEQLSAQRLPDFLGALRTPAMSELVMRKAAARREVLLAYLSQEGLLDCSDFALVDIGWSLRSQAALQRVLRSAGYETNLRGFYLGVSGKHVSITATGPVKAYVTPPESDVESPLHANWFFKLANILLLEHVFTPADPPTLASYELREGVVAPVFKQDTDGDVLKDYATRLQAEAVAYASAVSHHPDVDPTSSLFQETTLANLRLLSDTPELEDVEPIAWIPAYKDQSHAKEHRSVLASPIGVRDLLSMVLYQLVPKRRAFFSSKFAWNKGAVALSPAPIRFSYISLNALATMVFKTLKGKKRAK
jgi:predicted HAD superfamily hydrolase